VPHRPAKALIIEALIIEALTIEVRRPRAEAGGRVPREAVAKRLLRGAARLLHQLRPRRGGEPVVEARVHVLNLKFTGLTQNLGQLKRLL
jgi:RNase P protein component